MNIRKFKSLSNNRNIGATILPRRFLRNQVPLKGIRGGIRLNKTLIRTACEQQLVTTEVASANYRRILQKLKEIFNWAISFYELIYNVGTIFTSGGDKHSARGTHI